MTPNICESIKLMTLSIYHFLPHGLKFEFYKDMKGTTVSVLPLYLQGHSVFARSCSHWWLEKVFLIERNGASIFRTWLRVLFTIFTATLLYFPTSSYCKNLIKSKIINTLKIKHISQRKEQKPLGVNGITFIIYD